MNWTDFLAAVGIAGFVALVACVIIVVRTPRPSSVEIGIAPKDKYDLLFKAAIPLVALLFTIVLSVKDDTSKKTALDIARASAYGSVIQRLVSSNEIERALAVGLVLKLDPAEGISTLQEMAVNDQSDRVRSAAATALRQVVAEGMPDQRAKGQVALENSKVGAKLRGENRLGQLRTARSFDAQGKFAEASQQYLILIDQLPMDAFHFLAEHRLYIERGRIEIKGENYELAVQQFRHIFADFETM